MLHGRGLSGQGITTVSGFNPARLQNYTGPKNCPGIGIDPETKSQ